MPMIDFATFDEVDVEDKTNIEQLEGNEDNEATEENAGKIPNADLNQFDEDNNDKAPKFEVIEE